MKKLALAMSVVAVMAAISGAQAASTGTITFNGELTANTCDVSIEGQGADAVVTLPILGINQLPAASRTAGSTRFNMELTECVGTKASAFFEAGTTVLATGRLSNLETGTTAATEVELQLRDGSHAAQNVINVGSSSQVTDTTYVDISTGTATLPYLVEYYATGATTAGLVSSNVVYSIQYE